LEAEIVTNLRRIPAEKFFCRKLKISDTLKPGEIVEKIEIPLLKENPLERTVMHYDKFRLRDSLDFAIVSLSSLLSVRDGQFSSPRLVSGGAAPRTASPQRAGKFLIGQPVTAEVAEQAAELRRQAPFPWDTTTTR
jgi:CO/xanthine dehydrogenase FAD-binding subunit